MRPQPRNDFPIPASHCNSCASRGPVPAAHRAPHDPRRHQISQTGQPPASLFHAHGCIIGALSCI
jgi:hypothetical protein